MEQLRQIDEVTALLGNSLGMRVTQFTAAEDSKQRELIKDKFSNGEIQALVAIKCLDEGMNIPGIETAFILASSTNPKEYIQRRGRVLRKAPGKRYAKIYDFITLPRPLDEYSFQSSIQAELSLVNREVERMRDFQELAENPSDVTEIIRELTEKYNLYLNAIVAEGVNTTMQSSGAFMSESNLFLVSTTSFPLVSEAPYPPRPTFAP